MKPIASNVFVPIEIIQSKIYFIRGKKVMLDRDLAGLYGVMTKRLNEQVKRNDERFPADFMFQLTEEELENWKSQFATSNRTKMGLRKRPLAFTEQGVAMLSSVLHSKRAIQVNIQIMRTFVKMKEMISMHADMYKRFNRIEVKLLKYDKDIVRIFDVIKQIMELPVTLKRKPKAIGFKPPKA
jgi:ORF6N domain-containing protein